MILLPLSESYTKFIYRHDETMIVRQSLARLCSVPSVVSVSQRLGGVQTLQSTPVIACHGRRFLWPLAASLRTEKHQPGDRKFLHDRIQSSFGRVGKKKSLVVTPVYYSPTPRMTSHALWEAGRTRTWSLVIII